MPSSIDEHDNDDHQPQKKEKNRKPANTPFRQQRLRAWQPILTPKTVLPLFFLVGIVFAPIGGLLLYASAQVQELVLDYTDCDTLTPGGNFTRMPDSKFSGTFKSSFTDDDHPQYKFAANQTSVISTNQKYKENVCTIQFTLPNDLSPPVLMYYRLTNFFQNHRRYVQSMDTDQLKGKARTKSQLDDADNCTPLIGNDTLNKPYYPCGLIANSQFNDTFTSPVKQNSQTSRKPNTTYEMTTEGIAWPSDKEIFGKTQYNASDVMPPPNWIERYPDGYNDSTLPNLAEDPAFMVWMRMAALPTFSKMALRNDSAVMKAGTYEMKVYYRFPVREYSGTKSVVITTRTVMGGRNPFLGIAYVVVGGLCALLGTLFTGRHLFMPRKLGDHTLLSWNKEDEHRQSRLIPAPPAAVADANGNPVGVAQ